MKTIVMKTGADGSWEAPPAEPNSLYPSDVSEQELMDDILILADALDPKKVFDLSQKDWNILRGGGVEVNDIYEREKQFVLCVYISTVIQGTTVFEYPAEYGHFYCYKRDDLPADFDHKFGRKYLAILDHYLAQGLDKKAAIDFLQVHSNELISRALNTRKLSFFEEKILYPAAYGTRAISNGIEAALNPDIASRVRQLRREISYLHTDALRDAPEGVDKSEITAAVHAIHAWVEQCFLRPEFTVQPPARLNEPSVPGESVKRLPHEL
ncbi:MAG: hypothetical protein NTX63_05205 [Candidatus Peregrinibacteria bacterium]|nr:hypothetical protein [Candidatus Peregrinibacteria bacterium]